MRKIILDSQDQSLQGSLLSAVPRRKTQIGEAELERRLRDKRSDKYLESIRTLDAGQLAVGSKEYNELIETIREELPDPDALLGIVSKCYLGPPYEVHTLDITGGIIKHYPPYESLPALLECARSAARHAEYAFVEVYTGKMVVVRLDGSTSIIK